MDSQGQSADFFGERPSSAECYLKIGDVVAMCSMVADRGRTADPSAPVGMNNQGNSFAWVGMNNQETASLRSG
jgi:hypothetical protein